MTLPVATLALFAAAWAVLIAGALAVIATAVRDARRGRQRWERFLRELHAHAREEDR